MTFLIAITGGIGSGKSVVSEVLRVMGYDIYDCDSQAKRIMDTDPEIIDSIAQYVSAEAIFPDRTIDRKTLARIVFNDAAALTKLNGIVHEAVRKHLDAWRQAPGGSHIKFVETAILYQSGLDRMVDEVWEVIAPDELRIDRVIKRNNMTRAEVERRIESQQYTSEQTHKHVRHIFNGYNDAILPQVSELLRDQKL